MPPVTMIAALDMTRGSTLSTQQVKGTRGDVPRPLAIISASLFLTPCTCGPVASVSTVEGGNLLGKPKLAERLITRRFFKRKSKDPESYAYMKSGGHKKLYAESVLALNEAARAKGGDSGPYVMPMCLPVRCQPGDTESV